MNIVRLDDLRGLSEGNLLSLNLLYWTILSRDENLVVSYMEFLSSQQFFEDRQIMKRYPTATIFQLILLHDFPTILETIWKKDHLKHLFIQTMWELSQKSVHFLELILNHKNDHISNSLFDNNDICKSFFDDCLGPKNSQSENERLKKYEGWRENLHRNHVAKFTDKTKILLKQLFKKHTQILMHEMNLVARKDQFLSERKIISNVFERQDEEIFITLFSDSSICETFLRECLGFVAGETRDARVEVNDEKTTIFCKKLSFFVVSSSLSSFCRRFLRFH